MKAIYRKPAINVVPLEASCILAGSTSIGSNDFDYKLNESNVRKLALRITDNCYEMNRGLTRGYSVKKNEINDPVCVTCKNWQCKGRAVGHSGKFMFECFSVYIPLQSSVCLCNIDKKQHDSRSEDMKEIGIQCSQFIPFLPNNYDNIPRTCFALDTL